MYYLLLRKHYSVADSLIKEKNLIKSIAIPLTDVYSQFCLTFMPLTSVSYTGVLKLESKIYIFNPIKLDSNYTENECKNFPTFTMYNTQVARQGEIIIS